MYNSEGCEFTKTLVLYIINTGLRMFISVVLPIYNEEESIAPLIEGVVKVLETIGETYEIICIDDGSTDDTHKNLLKAKESHDCMTIIRFRKNFGKSPGLDAGFKEAKGDIIATMDADLQDDPNGIIPALEKLNEGYDMVSGWKEERHDPIGKTIPSKLFNFVVAKTFGLKLHDFNCGFKVYKKDVVKELNIYGEHHRFIPIIAYNMGFKVTELPVVHHSRKFGKSKFGIERFLSGFFDFITIFFISEYSSKPLHFIGGFGLLMGFLGSLSVFYLELNKFIYGISIGRRPLLIFGVFAIILGIQLIIFGLLAEMIANASRHSKQYYIKETIK